MGKCDEGERAVGKGGRGYAKSHTGLINMANSAHIARARMLTFYISGARRIASLLAHNSSLMVG